MNEINPTAKETKPHFAVLDGLRGVAALAVVVVHFMEGCTFLTQIHHRQTPMRVLYDESDAGPVWFTEAFYQQKLKNPIELIAIPDA